jgi:hypothetical protein
VRKLAVEDERHRLESAMRVWSERQAAIVGRIRLRTVVIEEEERVDLVDLGPGSGRIVRRSPMSSRCAACSRATVRGVMERQFVSGRTIRAPVTKRR